MKNNIDTQHSLLIIAPQDTLYESFSEQYERVDYFRRTDGLIDFFYQYKETSNLTVLIDLSLGRLEMLSLLKSLYSIDLIVNYIILDDIEDIDTAVEVYRSGGTVYAKKPQDIARLKVLFEISKEKKITQKQFNDTFYMDNLFHTNKVDNLYFLRNESDAALCYDTETVTQEIEAKINQRIDLLSKPNILLIEDEAINMQILKCQLKQYYTVFCATSGESALAILKEHADIHLIVLDVYLPDTLGTKLYKHIRKTHPTSKVIVFTAFEENDVARELIHAGAYDYLNKPYEEKDLQEKCLNAWRSYRWPFFEFNIDFNLLNDSQKMGLFKSHLCDLNKSNKLMYSVDVYSLFPELFLPMEFYQTS